MVFPYGGVITLGVVFPYGGVITLGVVFPYGGVITLGVVFPYRGVVRPIPQQDLPPDVKRIPRCHADTRIKAEIFFSPHNFPLVETFHYIAFSSLFIDVPL